MAEGYDENGAPIIRDYSGSGRNARRGYSAGQATDYGRLIDYAAGGGDLSGYTAPEQMFGGKDYRQWQAAALGKWNEAQSASDSYRLTQDRLSTTLPTEENPYNGLDPLKSRAPISTDVAQQYRDALTAGEATGGLQQQLGMLDPLQHTAGYSNPAFASNRSPRPSTPQLPTGAPASRVKPVSKGMNYLQSIMPQGGGQPSSGGSTMMSQALRGGAGQGQGGAV